MSSLYSVDYSQMRGRHQYGSLCYAGLLHNAAGVSTSVGTADIQAVTRWKSDAADRMVPPWHYGPGRLGALSFRPGGTNSRHYQHRQQQAAMRAYGDRRQARSTFTRGTAPGTITGEGEIRNGQGGEPERLRGKKRGRKRSEGGRKGEREGRIRN